MAKSNFPCMRVAELISVGALQVEDGNHGEYRPRRGEFSDKGMAFVRAADLADGVIDFEGAEKIDRNAVERVRKGLGEPLDVVLSHKGTVGKVAYVPTGSPPFVCSPQTTFWRSRDRTLIHPRFLYYALRSADFQNQLLALRGESDMAHYVSLTEQRKLSLFLPSITTQASIAAVLGVLDDKVLINERIGQTALDLMICLHGQALRSDSEVVAVGDVAVIFDGPHATPRKTSSGPWYLSISSLRGGRLLLDDSAHVSEADFRYWTRRVAPTSGDVLFSYETRLGEAAIMPSGLTACLGRRMALLRPIQDRVNPYVLLLSFLSEPFQETIRQRAVHGATVDRIPLAEIPAWPIELPAGNVRRLAETLDSLGELRSQFDREDRLLAELREQILPGLMSGEIRVRDVEKVVEEAT